MSENAGASGRASSGRGVASNGGKRNDGAGPVVKGGAVGRNQTTQEWSHTRARGQQGLMRP